MKKDTEEVLDTFFASISTAKTNIWESRVPKRRKKVESKEDLPSVEEGQVREHLKKFDILRSMGLDGVHPQVPGELVSVFHRLLLNYVKDKEVTGNSQQGFVEGKSSLMNLVDFFVEITSSVDEGEQWMLFILTLTSLSALSCLALS